MSILAISKGIQNSFDILDTWEAGIVLTGPEVKSVRMKRMNLKGSYISLEKGELWLKGAHISAYEPAATVQRNYDPSHTRKLLVRKQELHSLVGKLNEKGLTILPLNVYTKARLIKVEVALVRGKKKHDKRAVIKKREIDRDIRRHLKTQMR
ncbi:MAG: SsrA-binding protein SmpB [Candidatus Kerfeldbacteria bacterium]|nr:SsrA-binding protein SmpB [Candidatus Kerfeldbacteria bacterium]